MLGERLLQHPAARLDLGPVDGLGAGAVEEVRRRQRPRPELLRRAHRPAAPTRLAHGGGAVGGRAARRSRRPRRTPRAAAAAAAHQAARVATVRRASSSSRSLLSDERSRSAWRAARPGGAGDRADAAAGALGHRAQRRLGDQQRAADHDQPTRTTAPPDRREERLAAARRRSRPTSPPLSYRASQSENDPGPLTTWAMPSSASHGEAPADEQAHRARRLPAPHQRDAGGDQGHRDDEPADADDPAHEQLEPASERAGEVEVQGQRDDGAGDDQGDADELVLAAADGPAQLVGGGLAAGRRRRRGVAGDRCHWSSAAAPAARHRPGTAPLARPDERDGDDPCPRPWPSSSSMGPRWSWPQLHRSRIRSWNNGTKGVSRRPPSR